MRSFFTKRFGTDFPGDNFPLGVPGCKVLEDGKVGVCVVCGFASAGDGIIVGLADGLDPVLGCGAGRTGKVVGTVLAVFVGTGV